MWQTPIDTRQPRLVALPGTFAPDVLEPIEDPTEFRKTGLVARAGAPAGTAAAVSGTAEYLAGVAVIGAEILAARASM